MKKFAFLVALLCLAACEDLPAALALPDHPRSLSAPIPARGHSTEDYSAMHNPMEVSKCGYVSLFRECKVQ